VAQILYGRSDGVLVLQSFVQELGSGDLRPLLVGKHMRAKSKNYVLLAATVLSSVALALILAEVALRLIGFHFAFYPSKVQVGWPDPVTLKHQYVPDRQLLWVPKGYSSKVAAWKGERPSIVFMGDSCTEFGGYDRSLESMIDEKHPNNDYTFVNVGVGGWSSYQGLQQLKRDVLPMRPRVITIYYGWNDHWSSFGIEDKAIGKFNLEHPTFLLLLSRARVIQLVNRVLFTLKHRAHRNERKPERVSLSDFTSNLLQMIRVAREHGITPVLLTAPSSHRKGEEPAYLAFRWLNDLDELVPLHQAYVQAVRDVASRERVPLIDLYGEFRRLPEGEWKELFRDDGIHLTKEGDRMIAEFIYEYLGRRALVEGLITSPDGSPRASTPVWLSKAHSGSGAARI
jgi:lysophospholipase L1-like esterase